MDLSKLSVAELRALQEQLEQELKKREHEDIIKAREQIMAIAQSVGIPLKDLVSGQIRTKTGAGKEKGKRKEQVAVRYRHPSEPSLHWTGRGRQPGWIKDWIGSGRSLDALRV
jgi:DNA-binding protein H-NS